MGISDKQRAYTLSDSSVRIAAMVCYESIYGEHVNGFVNDGAELLFILTNDGWWRDTPGHRQHNAYAKLRAIETRRSIGRSANTGISCFINQKGDMLKQTKYWQPTAIDNILNTNNKITFYVKYGDYIGRTAYWVSGLLLLISFVSGLMERFKRK